MGPDLHANAQDKHLRSKLHDFCSTLETYLRNKPDQYSLVLNRIATVLKLLSSVVFQFPHPITPCAMQTVTPAGEQGSSCSPSDDEFHDKGKEGSDIVHQYTDENADNENNAVYVKHEPIITTGSDVSRFLVDVRDDGDPALTFRSLFIGTIFACLGATMCQVRLFGLRDVHSIFAYLIHDRSTSLNQFKYLYRLYFFCYLSTVQEWLGPRLYLNVNQSKGLDLRSLVPSWSL